RSCAGGAARKVEDRNRIIDGHEIGESLPRQAAGGVLKQGGQRISGQQHGAVGCHDHGRRRSLNEEMVWPRGGSRAGRSVRPDEETDGEDGERKRGGCRGNTRNELST